MQSSFGSLDLEQREERQYADEGMGIDKLGSTAPTPQCFGTAKRLFGMGRAS